MYCKQNLLPFLLSLQSARQIACQQQNIFVTDGAALYRWGSVQVVNFDFVFPENHWCDLGTSVYAAGDWTFSSVKLVVTADNILCHRVLI